MKHWQAGLLSREVSRFGDAGELLYHLVVQQARDGERLAGLEVDRAVDLPRYDRRDGGGRRR